MAFCPLDTDIPRRFMYRRLLPLVLVAQLWMGAAHAADVQSYLPQASLPQFVVDHFDLSTIRSSLEQTRLPGRRNLFPDRMLGKWTYTNTTAVLDVPNWFFKITILGVGDYNDDGIQDIAICFVDQDKQAAHSTTRPYLLTRYASGAPLTALAFEINDDRCQPAVGDNK